MQAADNVEGWGLSSGWPALLLLALAVLQVLVVGRLVEELSATGCTFACLAVLLAGVLLAGLIFWIRRRPFEFETKTPKSFQFTESVLRD